MITKPALTLDDAKQLMEAAEAEARRNGWEVVIAILNDGGRIVALHRMDGARPGNAEPVTGKDLRAAVDALLDGRKVDAEQVPSVGCNIKWKAGNAPDYYG